MGSIFSLGKSRRRELSGTDAVRFRKFAYANARPGLTLLTFSMPTLFFVGWARDVIVLGSAASWTLLIRLSITFGLLILAWLIRTSGFSRTTEVFGVLYALLFSVAIATTSAIEPERLSLTHVAVMLMAVILLPFAPSRMSAIGVVAALALPMAALLAYLDAPASLWGAYALFFATGCVIGFTQRNAQLAASMEIFLHRRRLMERLHRDSLTGAINRDGWTLRASRMHRRELGEDKRFSVIYVDLDHFKQVNDTHGHSVGDTILQDVTDAMKRQLRDGDLLARVGGEEFVVLLPDVDGGVAMQIAERMRAAVATMAGEAPMTISIGVTQARPGEAVHSATERADGALLEAKRRGRNRVVLA